MKKLILAFTIAIIPPISIADGGHHHGHHGHHGGWGHDNGFNFLLSIPFLPYQYDVPYYAPTPYYDYRQQYCDGDWVYDRWGNVHCVPRRYYYDD